MNARDLIPQTTVAVRLTGEQGWRIEALAYTPDEVKSVLAAKREHLETFRVVSFRHIVPSAAAHPDYRSAHGRGWLWDEPAGCWRPQEEPITPPPGAPRPGRIELVLRSVRFGWVTLDVRTSDATVEVLFDDVQDSFVPVVRFVSLLVAGGHPHFGVIGSETPVAMATFPAREPGLCRLIAGRLTRWVLQPDLDLLVDRQALIEEFRTFLKTLADHPCFGPMWLCHAGVPSEPYDTISDELWELGVQERRWEDDWDAAGDFKAEYIATRIPLSPEVVAYIDQYRAMLRTLSIPFGWE
jgi:hypothetical protein